MLKQEGFELSRSRKALDMLLNDRKNEFGHLDLFYVSVNYFEFFGKSI